MERCDLNEKVEINVLMIIWGVNVRHGSLQHVQEEGSMEYWDWGL